MGDRDKDGGVQKDGGWWPVVWCNGCNSGIGMAQNNRSKTMASHEGRFTLLEALMDDDARRKSRESKLRSTSYGERDKKAGVSAAGNGILELEKRGRALVESRMLARLDEARHFRRPFECVNNIASFTT